MKQREKRRPKTISHLFYGVSCLGRCHRFPYLLHLCREHFPVLRPLYRGDGRAQHAHIVALKHPAVLQGHATVQGRLTAEGQQDGIRPLCPDHLIKKNLNSFKNILILFFLNIT